MKKYQIKMCQSALDTNNVVEVPTDGMIIVGGIYYGISKDWFQTNNPNKETLTSP